MILRAALLFAALWFVKAYETDEDEMNDAVEELSEDTIRKLVSRLDVNHDGKVSVQEMNDFQTHVTKRIASKDVPALLEEIDTSKDGKVSLEEHINDMEQISLDSTHAIEELEARKAVETQKFKAADKDGDGLLTAEELPALYGTTDDAVLDVHVGEAMKHKDHNQDGKLSIVEFYEADDDEDAQLLETAREDDDFDKLDKNKDGFVDASELRAWESGAFHLALAIDLLLKETDKDQDMHVTVEELIKSRENLSQADGHFHLAEWVKHVEL